MAGETPVVAASRSVGAMIPAERPGRRLAVLSKAAISPIGTGAAAIALGRVYTPPSLLALPLVGAMLAAMLIAMDPVLGWMVAGAIVVGTLGATWATGDEIRKGTEKRRAKIHHARLKRACDHLQRNVGDLLQIPYADTDIVDEQPRWTEDPAYREDRMLTSWAWLLRTQEHSRDAHDRLALAVMDLLSTRDRALADLEHAEADARAAVGDAAERTMRTLIDRTRDQVEERRKRLEDDARRRAPDVVRRFAIAASAMAGADAAPAETPRPSTTASLARLTAIAEQALVDNPHLADGAGGRIDDLFRIHVPRLARTHATAAGCARIEDLASIDATLDEGIEQARTSLAEALDADADRRFDALRTEVGFLRMRRGTAA